MHTLLAVAVSLVLSFSQAGKKTPPSAEPHAQTSAPPSTLAGSPVAAPAPVPPPKKPAAAKPAAPPPACTVKSYSVAGIKDGASLAAMLSGAFSGFDIRAGAPPAGTSQTSVTLYAVDHGAAQNPADCLNPKWKSELHTDELDRAFAALNGRNATTVAIGASLLVRLPHLETASVRRYFPQPAPSYELLEIDTGLFLLQAQDAPKAGTASAPTDAARAAARDFVLLDQQAQPPADSSAEDFLNSLRIPSSDPRGIIAANWIAMHTITLSQLDVRQAILAFADLFDKCGLSPEPMSSERSLLLLPRLLPGDLRGRLLAAEMVERNLLYQQKQAELEAQSAAGKNPAEKQKALSPPAVTIKATTATTTTPATGKIPVTTTSVTTIASQPGAGASLQGGAASSPAAKPTGGAQAPPAPSGGKGSNPAAQTGEADDSSSTDTARGDTPAAAPTTAGETPGGSSSPGQTPAQGASQGQNPANSTKTAGDSTQGTTSSKGAQVWSGDRVVRLYHLRQASEIAKAINATLGSNSNAVEAIGEDLLLIRPVMPGQPDSGEAIRHALAVMDLPRPQISLRFWSYQISARAKEDHSGVTEVQKDFNCVQQKIHQANNVSELALQAGMGAIQDDMKAKGSSYFDPDFYGYLTETYESCVNQDRYCLGYLGALPHDTFETGDLSASYSLSRFLLNLAAASDANVQQTLNHMRRAMTIVLQNPSEAGAIAGGTEKEMLDLGEYKPSSHLLSLYPASGASKEGSTVTIPEVQISAMLDRFFSEMAVFTEKRNIHKVRAALLDFLFQYKLSRQYPREFSPFYLQRAAHVLDSMIGPVMDAFNESLDAMVSETVSGLDRCKNEIKSKDIESATYGEIQVAVISGNTAKVTGNVNNYFDITQIPTLADMLNSSSSTSQALGTSLRGVLQPKELTIMQAIANANSPQRITAEISKGAALTVTPNSLDSASSADLDLDFEVKDNTDSGNVTPSTAQKQDFLDRVADHHVITRVRVDSLKLFQVSALTMEITHKSPRKCFWNPFCATWEGFFGSIPGFGRVGQYTPAPKTVDNRSVAVVRAVIVPTSMDLGLGLRFVEDRIVDPVTDTAVKAKSIEQVGEGIFIYHTRLIECISSDSGCLEKVHLSEKGPIGEERSRSMK
jgi:hypothetical protein